MILHVCDFSASSALMAPELDSKSTLQQRMELILFSFPWASFRQPVWFILYQLFLCCEILLNGEWQTMCRKEGATGIGENWASRSSDKGDGDVGLGLKKN